MLLFITMDLQINIKTEEKISFFSNVLHWNLYIDVQDKRAETAFMVQFPCDGFLKPKKGLKKNSQVLFNYALFMHYKKSRTIHLEW